MFEAIQKQSMKHGVCKADLRILPACVIRSLKRGKSAARRILTKTLRQAGHIVSHARCSNMFKSLSFYMFCQQLYFLGLKASTVCPTFLRILGRLFPNFDENSTAHGGPRRLIHKVRHGRFQPKVALSGDVTFCSAGPNLTSFKPTSPVKRQRESYECYSYLSLIATV